MLDEDLRKERTADTTTCEGKVVTAAKKSIIKKGIKKSEAKHSDTSSDEAWILLVSSMVFTLHCTLCCYKIEKQQESGVQTKYYQCYSRVSRINSRPRVVQICCVQSLLWIGVCQI